MNALDQASAIVQATDASKLATWRRHLRNHDREWADAIEATE